MINVLLTLFCIGVSIFFILSILVIIDMIFRD
uniref:Uncharacterized protein n=1 Tax=Podoviridae sp. ctack17 TaxID=2825260 RepID=A0A8S5PZR0_9CAUD|nr:MAG TPA: hypothetical protein [Podoviridae sp. ctack17]